MQTKLALLAFASLLGLCPAQANTIFDLDISPSGTNGPAVFYLGTGPTYPMAVSLEIVFSNPGGGPLALTLPPNSNLGTCTGGLSAGSTCVETINDVGPFIYGTAQIEPQTFSFTDAAGVPITDNVTIELEPELAPTPLPATLPLFGAGLGVMGLLARRRKRKAYVAHALDASRSRCCTRGRLIGAWFMQTKLLGLFVLLALLVGATVSGHASPYVVTIEQVGSNVVASGSGAIDLTGLTFIDPEANSVFVIPDLPDIITGSVGTIDLYEGKISGPTNFGSGHFTSASSGSGDGVGTFNNAEVFVPVNYVSDTALLDSAIYDNATFATLGLTTGTYVWTWGAGANQSFTLDITSATPLPAAFPLFATGLGAIGLLGWRRKRKAALGAIGGDWG
jgi:PEP-CTERM motif-containing protein